MRKSAWRPHLLWLHDRLDVVTYDFSVAAFVAPRLTLDRTVQTTCACPVVIAGLWVGQGRKSSSARATASKAYAASEDGVPAARSGYR